MASFAEIANDLDARAKILERRRAGEQDHARSMRRGAEAIRSLLDEVDELRGAYVAHDVSECDLSDAEGDR